MARQFRISRRVGVAPVVAGGFATFDLPRQYDAEAVFFRIAGSVQVTVAGAAVRAEAPAQVVSRVELIADGKNTIYSAPGWHGIWAHNDRASMEANAEIATPPTAAGIATYPIAAVGVVDLMTPDGVRPKDSNFRTSGLQLWQCRVSFGIANDLFTGAPTAAFVNCTVEIFVQELVELPDAAGAFSTPSMLKKVSYQEIALPASNANQELRLPAGNLIRSVMLRTEVSGEPSAAVLNALQMFAGVDYRLTLTERQIRGKGAHDYGRAAQIGYYFADVTARGLSEIMLADLWDVSQQAEPKISMDVNGGANNKAQAVVTEYIALAR